MFGYDNVKKAYEKISPFVVKTPLIRAENLDEFFGCKVYLKLENLQKTGSFKLRGATNKIKSLNKEELKGGVVAASSGNHGKAVSFSAKNLNLKCKIVVPETAAKVKINAIKNNGAEILLCKPEDRFKIAKKIADEEGKILIHPFDDEAVIAGQGTVGIEISEYKDDFDKIIVPTSGGGLLGGIAAAISGTCKNTEVYGAEPAVMPKYSKSLEKGEIVQVEQKPTIADALVSNKPGEISFEVVKNYAKAVVDVEEDAILKASKILLAEGKIFSEVSSAIGLAAVLSGKIKVNKEESVCFVISGGNAGLDIIEKLKNI